jgi:serine/threonine protein kinase
MDITSSNIVLDEDFNARLIDFGLAREMNEYQTKVTLTPSKQFGTPGYFRTKRYSDLTVCEDYYNFGVGKFLLFKYFSI